MARRALSVAVTAMMSALAVVISLLRLEAPFPVLTYLKFDLAEVPSVLTFLLAGPWWSYFCALMHAVGLLIRGSDPLGASMKFLAVASMLAGMQLARRRWRVALAAATALRVAAMSVANLLVLGFLFPGWLAYAERLLRAAGVPVGGRGDVLLITLALTAVFNALHVLLSVVPSAIVAERVRRALKL